MSADLDTIGLTMRWNILHTKIWYAVFFAEYVRCHCHR